MLKIKNLKVEIVCCVLFVAAVSLGLFTDYYFHPSTPKISELASDAINGAVSSFLEPLRKASNQTVTQFESRYGNGLDFLYPALMYSVSTLLIVIALFLIYRFKKWDRKDKWGFGISAAIFIVSGIMGLIFCFKMLKNLFYALVHIGTFWIVLSLIAIGLFMLIQSLFKSNNHA